MLFIDLEPDFEGTAEQISVFSNIVLQKTGKQVFTYAGESIIKKLGLERVDWYPNYGEAGNFAHGSFIHQYSESLSIPGYDGKLDANISNKSIDEIRNIGKLTTPTPPKEPETPKSSEPDTKPSEPEKPQKTPEIKPEGDKPTGLWLSKLIIELVKLILGIFKKK